MSEYLEATVDKFLFRVATGRLYTSEGVWVLSEGIRVRVGVTDYFQQLNGDVAFVHLKPVGTMLAVGDELAVIETIKATMDFLSPIRGTVAEVNPELDLSPEFLNQDPYGKGWLAVIEATAEEPDRANLLDANAYLQLMRSQAEKEMNQS